MQSKGGAIVARCCLADHRLPAAQAKKGQSLPAAVSLIMVCRSGGNVATATELAGSTKAVAGCQQWVEAKTRHLQNQCHVYNSEEVGGDINDDDDGDDDDGDW